MDLSKQTEHRPWPLPSGPWVMKQSWNRLLFAHWEVAADRLRPLVPPQLELDTYDGKAWVAVVPFDMSGIRLRGLPPIPGTVAFPECNVRTYVTVQGKPGVYFFSLEAANALAVALARRFFHLPYFRADMRMAEAGGSIRYDSRRTHGGAPAAVFEGSYGPTSETYRAEAGSLEAWLTERYCLYTVHEGTVYRGDIHHEPWPLQRAEAELRANTLAAASGIELPNTAPLLHYASTLDVLIWPLARC
ncbi:DUF2071 domain-containing protein [Paenibacillus sp. TRM 82003]|nr:DUF2071 domain-containing protein [Paenibacillus sp. TRM 82003]